MRIDPQYRREFLDGLHHLSFEQVKAAQIVVCSFEVWFQRDGALEVLRGPIENILLEVAEAKQIVEKRRFRGSLQQFGELSRCRIKLAELQQLFRLLESGARIHLRIRCQ